MCVNTTILAYCKVVSKEHDGFIISDLDENLQGPTMYMCASFDVFLANEQDGTQS